MPRARRRCARSLALPSMLSDCLRQLLRRGLETLRLAHHALEQLGWIRGLDDGQGLEPKDLVGRHAQELADAGELFQAALRTAAHPSGHRRTALAELAAQLVLT